MADSCCKAETRWCEPPALVLPGQCPMQTLPTAACGTAADACCPKGVPVFDGMNPRYKRILWTVISINGAMFLSEMIAGRLAGSQALKADALDFFADTVAYGLSLAVIGASLRTRATAALAKGVSLSLTAMCVFGSTVYQTLFLVSQKRMSWDLSACWRWLQTFHRCCCCGLTRMATRRASVWLCSRNGAIGNIIVMGAAVWGVGHGENVARSTRRRHHGRHLSSPRRCKFSGRHGRSIAKDRTLPRRFLLNKLRCEIFDFCAKQTFQQSLKYPLTPSEHFHIR